MNRHLYKKLITAALFIAFLFAFSIMNLREAYKPLKQTLLESDFHFSSWKDTISRLEATMNDTVYEKFKFIEAYGFLQKAMDKNEESNFEVVKDREGKLHFTYFTNGPNPTKELSNRVQTLGERVNDKNTKLTYVMTPDKYIRGYTTFPEGIPYSYSNETADQFLNELRQAGVDTLDLREGLLRSGIPASELFFKTDHHWQIETAFWGFGQLVKHLDGMYATKLDPDGYFTDIHNYNAIKYEDAFIGSLGRKTGKYYSGTDSFTLIYPKFKTNYSYTYALNQSDITLEGRFEESLITSYPLNVKGSEYGLTGDKYFTYLYGNQPFAHITNKDRPNGLKFLFIKDSLAIPMISFLSTVSSDIYIIDPRYYKGDIQTFINQTKLDHIFVSFSPQDLVKEFFPFGVK